MFGMPSNIGERDRERASERERERERDFPIFKPIVT
jgi:hypothetical protein